MAITTIAPSILAETPANYKQLVERYYPFAKRVHIDISDGTLAHNKTIAMLQAILNDLLPLFDTLKNNGIRVGVAIVRSVYPGSIKAILSAADHALIFSGELGKYGGKADLLLGEKAALIQDIHPGIEIGWDGGANLENTRELTHIGISVINVGSALSKAENPAKVFEELNKETEKEDPI